MYFFSRGFTLALFACRSCVSCVDPNDLVDWLLVSINDLGLALKNQAFFDNPVILVVGRH